MTWRSRIFFSLLWISPGLAAGVTGKVELTDSRSTARKHKDFSGVVVWLEPLNGNGARTAISQTSKHAEMVQKDKTFIPHVLAIPVGATVTFPNFDPIFHNAFSHFSGMPFDVGLYPPNTTQSVLFKREGVVRVFCNIHQTMSAVIVVLKTPWFAVTRANGAFEIANVPPGEYRLRVFHERSSVEQLTSLERKVVVEDGPLQLGGIVISEAGFLATPHKNKYGKDYPAESDDHVIYPGVKK